jgi:hypothetical protein
VVCDERAKFALAVKVGNMEVAESMARQVGDKEVWKKLGEAALLHGNVGVAEVALQNSGNIAGLSFLYLVTGQLAKLWKMGCVAGEEKAAGQRFVNGACCGSVMQQAAALRARGLERLAAHTLGTHGLGSGAGIVDRLGSPVLPPEMLLECEEEQERTAGREMEQLHAAGYALPTATFASPSSSHLIRPYTRFSAPRLLLPPLLLSADAGKWSRLRIARAPLSRSQPESLPTGRSLRLGAEAPAGMPVGGGLVKRQTSEKCD